MIALIISEFVTITLTLLRDVTSTPASPKMELYVTIVHSF